MTSDNAKPDLSELLGPGSDAMEQNRHPTLPVNDQRPKAALWLERLIRPVEGVFDRIYGLAYNPFYRSGPTAILLFLVALVTGIYLFLFYQTTTPWESIRDLHGQWWAGRWIRTLHRYTADAAMFFVAVHVLKMFVQGKTWGPRVLAWVSGVILVGFMLLCGWSGLIMVWDEQGIMVAREVSALLDLLPIFSEPLTRSFAGDQPVFATFFFMNLFLHVATPLALAFFLWVHTSRVARPSLLPPKPLAIAIVAVLVVAAIAHPLALQPKADPLRLPGVVPIDFFYGAFLPVARAYGTKGFFVLWSIVTAVLWLAPWWWRPAQARRSGPSVVDERRCGGCMQCYLDCPYEAIQMVKREHRTGGQSAAVARISPDLCMRCGICAASCDPMTVGPPGRTGRDQLRQARTLVTMQKIPAGHVAVIGCSRGLGLNSALTGRQGVYPWPVDCVGSLHTSIIEYAIKKGASGVFIVSCPGRDCTFREGPKWLAERVYRGREAKLKEHVDKRRVRVTTGSLGELARVGRELATFQAEVAALPPVVKAAGPSTAGAGDGPVAGSAETSGGPRHEGT